MRILPYTFFNIGDGGPYFNDEQNKIIIDKIADNCYLPANQILFDQIQQLEGKFRLAFSISGVALEQFAQWRPDVIASFQRLAQTGCVEFLGETYYHSLSGIFSPTEFERQVKLHSNLIEKEFGQKPQVFRNTELIYWNGLAPLVSELGFKAILTEGWEKYLQERSSNFVYKDAGNHLSLLLKDYKLSDDIAFRFTDPKSENFPLTAAKFVADLYKKASDSDVINLFMDYETFGEHHGSETGIFDFLKELPTEVLKNERLSFFSPSEIIAQYPSKGIYNVPAYLSWADTERDLSAWQGNAMQQESAEFLYSLEERVLARPELLEAWSKLQTSDHLYYMSTKGYGDGAVHNYFNAFRTPYDANIYFMNILSDLELQLL
jgi:alpha-amylase